MPHMKRIIAVLVSLALLLSTAVSFSGTAAAHAEPAGRTTKIDAHFATVEEGQERMRGRTLVSWANQ